MLKTLAHQTVERFWSYPTHDNSGIWSNPHLEPLEKVVCAVRQPCFGRRLVGNEPGDPLQLIPYNYVVFGVSRYEGT